MISKKLDIKDNFVIFLFATIPVATIIGNFFLNFYLLCIFFIFIFTIFKTKNFNQFKENDFIILLIFYLYICVNSLINYYTSPEFGYDGLIRSLLFLKFLMLLPAIPLLINKKETLEKIFKFWLFIIFIIIVDIFFEKYNGSNLFGFKSLDQSRITSFFYDENVVGAFLFGFGFITIIFFLQNNVTKKFKIILNLALVLILLSILITGERSAFLKSTLLFLFIFYFINESKLFIKKFYLLIFTFFFALSLFFIFPNVLSKQTEFLNRILNVKNPKSFSQRLENIKYFLKLDNQKPLTTGKKHRNTGLNGQVQVNSIEL